MSKRYLPLLYIIIIVSVFAYSVMTRSEPEIVITVDDAPDFGMAFPIDYRDNFVRYLEIDRVDDTVRHIFIDPIALDAIGAGQELPFGTQIIIETWDASKDIFGNVRRNSQGHLIAGTMRPNLHLMEKQADWTTEQLPSPVGVIDWNFASFDIETMLPSTENRNDCLTCHDGGAFRRDFVFSRFIIEDFIENPDNPEFLYCSLPRRGNCIR